MANLIIDGVECNSLTTIPKDGTLCRILVQFSDNSLEDETDKPIWTIGFNASANELCDFDEAWYIAGWDWSHDQFTRGVGTPVAWLPMIGEVNHG